jgi:hypothetical protein
MSAPDVVKAAKAKSIKLDVQYVYAVRGAKKKRSKAARSVAKTAPALVASSGNGSSTTNRSAGGLEAEIERIVERKVGELLKARLGALFG